MHDSHPLKPMFQAGNCVGLHTRTLPAGKEVVLASLQLQLDCEAWLKLATFPANVSTPPA
jgi:hypothetical protein